MPRRKDDQAAIYAHELREFQLKVMAPVLERLQPIPPALMGGPQRYMVQIARDNGHNALCYEARLSFALTVGATFERYLRLWLSLASPDLRLKIERADRSTLIAFVEELKGPAVATRAQCADLIELWELVSTARHGNGPSTGRLRLINPELWSHDDAVMQDRYTAAGLRAHRLRVKDWDLERYFTAAIGFWRAVAGS